MDDLDRLYLDRSAKLQLLKVLTEFAEVVIVTANDITHQLEDVVYSRDSRVAEIEFQPHRLLEFGHYLRNALVERWFAIGSDAIAAAERLAREWAQIRRTIDTVVGRNFVPAYPLKPQVKKK